MTTQQDKKRFIQDFEYILYMAELKALSKHSLENPISVIQYKRMMELKELLFK